MSEFLQNREHRVKSMIGIVQKLRQGITLEDIKREHGDFIAQITPHDILNLENTFLEQGVTIAEIKENIEKQLAIFKESLIGYKWSKPELNHPLRFYMDENAKLNDELDWIVKEILKNKGESTQDLINKLLEKLKLISHFENHYVRKEIIIFPYMEKLGYAKPMAVMWSLDDDARDIWKSLIKELENATSLTEKQTDQLNILVQLMKGTIFKEDRIVFPVAMDRLSNKDWFDIYNQSIDQPYFNIEPPKENAFTIDNVEEEKKETNLVEGLITLGKTGALSLESLITMLNVLPVDLTFVDENQEVRYFSDNKERVFPRSPAIIGRKVRYCHPPESVHIVMQVIEELQSGKDYVDFWINYRGKFVYITYFAIRDENGNYKGTLEVTMDATKIRSLEGEKRLLDYDQSLKL